MEPTLVAGQALLGALWPRACVDELRVFEHPERPGFWLVKRVAEIAPGNHLVVHSDNELAPAVDSRAFGPVPVAGSYRVVWMSKGPIR